MARELSEIKLQITDEWINNETIQERYELTPGQTFDQQFSKVSVENILFSVIAFAIWFFEKLIGQNQSEINEQIANSRIHTQKWYRQKALDFMYGYELGDLDTYDTTGLTDEQIAAAKIIANAAPVKMQGSLRLKVVKRVGGELAPLSPAELNAFESYMNSVTDAGTYVIPTTNVADDLKLTLDIYYNDQILAGDGSRLDGTANTPVLDAIKEYLKSLRFNGAFIGTKLQDEIQTVQGVNMVKIVGAWSKYGLYDYDTTINPNAGSINEVRVADAGYMKLDEANTEINFIAFNNE